MSGLVQDRGRSDCGDCRWPRCYGAGRRCLVFSNPWTRPPGDSAKARRPALPSSKRRETSRFHSGARAVGRTSLAPLILLWLAGGEASIRARPNWARLVLRVGPLRIAVALNVWGRLSDPGPAARADVDGHRGGSGNARAVGLELIAWRRRCWRCRWWLVCPDDRYHGVGRGGRPIWWIFAKRPAVRLCRRVQHRDWGLLLIARVAGGGAALIGACGDAGFIRAHVRGGGVCGAWPARSRSGGFDRYGARAV